MKIKNVEHMRNVSILMTLVTGLILLIPLTLMQTTSEVHWTLLDFAVAGFLLFSMGFIFQLVLYKVQTFKNRVIIGGLIALAFLVIWVHLAVGTIDSWPLAGS
jgi:hypothetical protein